MKRYLALAGAGLLALALVACSSDDNDDDSSASSTPSSSSSPAASAEKPLTLDTTYVNVGFWGTVHVGPERENAPKNRAIEAKVHELGGHKSLYSEAFYDRATFDALYDGDHLAGVKARFDPDDRLTGLYDKVVRRA